MFCFTSRTFTSLAGIVTLYRKDDMKYIFAVLTLFFLTTFVFSGDFDKVVFQVTNVATSTTPDEVKSQKITGYIERIMIKVNTDGVNVDFDVIASNSYSHTEITLYSADDVTTNVNIYPRTETHTTAGVAVTNESNLYNRFFVYQDNIVFKAGDEANTNKNVLAIIYYEKK